MAKQTGTAMVQRTPSQLATLNAFQGLIMAVPEAGGDGIGILENIVNVTDPNALIGDDSQTTPIESLYGKDIRVDKISRVPSEDQYITEKSITDQFLILEGVNLTDNTDFVATTSAATVLAKLSKLYELHALPATVRLSESKTRAGFDVMNCSVLAITESVTV